MTRAGLLLLVLASTLSTLQVQAQPRVIGYHAWWMTDAWRGYDLDLYDKILFFELAVEADGTVRDLHGWPEAWTGMIAAVHEKGGKVAPAFAILDPVTYSSVLGNRTARDRLRRRCDVSARTR